MWSFKKFKLVLLLVVTSFITSNVKAQESGNNSTIQPRIRVIIDNDFGGDPDGLFQLAEQVLSPSTSIKAIVCSHHYNDFFGNDGTVGTAKREVDSLLATMNKNGIPVLLGSDSSLKSLDKPLISDGAEAIVKEAMLEDNRPLYVLCGAGLTNIASAWLMNPDISKRITAVVWIGGSEYPDLCKNQLQKQREYNQGIDPISAQVVFNRSDMTVWQIPRDVYRQALYSYAELKSRIGSAGKTGTYLLSKLEKIFKLSHGSLGETYILGDSPLVLVTSLQSPWEADASSCEYVIRKTPFINDKGFYDDNPNGRPIRIYTKIDSRLILEDLIAKLKANN